MKQNAKINPNTSVDYDNLRKYRTEDLIKEHLGYRSSVEEYPSHSFPDVLAKLVIKEGKLREELSRRGVSIKQPKRLTSERPKRQYVDWRKWKW